MDDFEARRKMNDLKKQVGKEMKAPKPVRSPFRRFLRGVMVVVVIGGYIVVGVGGFVLGRLSIYPEISSHVPTTTATLPPDTATPEEVVQGYYEAIKHRNLDQALTLFHTDRRRYNAERTQSLIERYLLIDKIDILTSQEQSSASVFVTYTMKNGGYTSRQGFELRKEGGAWKIYDM